MNSNKPKPVKSSYIAAYSYNPDSYELSITFKNGVERTYKDVKPPLMSQVFDSSGSVGSKFIRLIGRKHKGSEEQE